MNERKLQSSTSFEVKKVSAKLFSLFSFDAIIFASKIDIIAFFPRHAKLCNGFSCPIKMFVLEKMKAET